MKINHIIVSTEKVIENKRPMSRAAKGNEKYGKNGMKALAKAGREGASEKKLDTVRNKYDNYNEGWSQKYKSSINCSHPKGFSQKAHCAGKKKHNESIEMEMVCEDCGMCETHGDHSQKSLDEACWKGYHKEGMKTMFGKKYPNCIKNKNESLETYVNEGKCPGCGGAMVGEGQLNEKQDACYHKVKSRYKVWPSAYASGALVQCRKKGAANWGNSNESITQEEYNQLDENLKKWFSDKWVRFGPDGKIKGDCARGDDSEGKPKCLPQSKAQSLGKKGRASAASRKRREDPNPERSGPAINVSTNKKSNEGVTESDLDRFKKYTRPVVKTTPKIEKTTNPAGRTTDHVEWKVTTPTGEIHRYNSKKQAQEKFDSFGQQGVAEGEVVPFPKKHPYELLTNCRKCGGLLQGGKDEKGRLKMCIPCMTLYRAPIQQGVAEGSLNELSKDTLKSYGKKAVADGQASQKRSQIEIGKAASTKDDETAKTHYDAAKQAKDRTEKRMAGLSGAIKRLTKQGVAEGFNGEYDDEAGMAQSNLITTARAVMGLLKTIKDRDNLPEWGQEKIAKAEMMLVSVWDYLQSQKAMGNDPQQGVAEGERTMSRAAKGYEKYGKKGMQALAKAGRDDASDEKLNTIRNKHNKYDEGEDPYFESLRARVEELAKK